jgi:glycosyltransferase involved in cell wall biosynthesis
MRILIGTEQKALADEQVCGLDGYPLVTYIIPVFNQEKTIGKSIRSALICAEKVNGRVIVCVNQCTDNTLSEVKLVQSQRLVVLVAKVFVTSIENLESGLQQVTTPYVVLNGGDDILDPSGQVKLATVCRHASSPSVLVGDFVSIDAAENIIGTSAMIFSWNNVSRKRAMLNVLQMKYPNLNGAWVPIDTYKAALRYTINSMSPAALSNAGDIPIWWHIAKTVPVRYVPGNQVKYRITETTSPNIYYQRSRAAGLRGKIGYYRNAIEEYEDNWAISWVRFRLLVTWRIFKVMIEARLLGKHEQQLLWDLLDTPDWPLAIRQLSIFKCKAPILFEALSALYEKYNALDMWLRSQIKKTIIKIRSGIASSTHA